MILENNYGNILIRPDGTYLVNGYHVCSKDVDPLGKYDFDDVKKYAEKYPDRVTIEPETIISNEEKLAIEKAGILRQLADIDMKSLRYLRAIAEGTIDQVGKDKLAELETSAQELRLRL